MNNRYYAGLCSLIVMCSLFSACTFNNDQIKEISKNAGLFSSTTWVAIDNPSAEVIKHVSDILVVVKEKASSVESGKTYFEVLYPELVKIIETNVQDQYKPLCKAGVITILGQLDLLFINHPEWKTEQNKAIDVVNAFIDGAVHGLNLDEQKKKILNNNYQLHSKE